MNVLIPINPLNMKKLLLLFTLALTAGMASAQTNTKYYMNVQTEPDKVQSYEVTPDLKVSWEGTQKGATPSGYYNKDEVDAMIKSLEERLAKAEYAITQMSTNFHDYVELAGYKWATVNVGEVAGLTAHHSVSDQGEDYGYLYNKEDAQKAVKSWGGTWSLPTTKQWQALTKNCYWKWEYTYVKSEEPHHPYIFTAGFVVYEAKSDEDKGKVNEHSSSTSYDYQTDPHIFLPAAGIYGTDSTINERSVYGVYWAAEEMNCLSFGHDIASMYFYPEYNGLCVRPVLAE